MEFATLDTLIARFGPKEVDAKISLLKIDCEVRASEHVCCACRRGGGKL